MKQISPLYEKTAWLIKVGIVSCICFFLFIISANAQNYYFASLSGANEEPPVSTNGTGTALVTITGTQMRVQASFQGLTGTTTACHIHAATVNPGTGTAGVATTTPTFPGFPGGVTSGSYDNTFDMTQSSSYNATYINNNGGTPSSAFNALVSALNAGKAYLNIHTTFSPGGEIRGFLNPCTAPSITSVTAETNPVCTGNTTILTANGVSGTNAVVTWYSGPGGTGSNLGTGLTLSGAGAGTYYARVTASCGNAAEASITVTSTSTDNTQPNITCPGDTAVNLTSGTACSKFVRVADPVYSDNCSVSSLKWTMTGATTGSSSGSGIKLVGGKAYNAGTTVVSYTAKDPSGNSKSCSFNVIINDLIKPVFNTTNNNISASANANCKRSISVPDISYSDNCGIPALSWTMTGATVASGNGQIGTFTFNTGTTKVTYTLTDIWGNTRISFFKVIITDFTPPVVTCPADTTRKTLGTDCFRNIKIGPPVYADNCGVKTLTWTMSGATTGSSPLTGIRIVGQKSFNVGTTIITYTATDAAGNSGACSMNVTVTTTNNCAAFTSARGIIEREELASYKKMSAILSPNPAINAFGVSVASDNTGPITINVYSNDGKRIQQIRTFSNTTRFGEKLQPGIYLVEVIQGDKRTTLTGIKK